MTAEIIVYNRSCDLDQIAERIRTRNRRTVQDILDTGRDLIAAKQELDHGAFGAWLDKEFGWEVRSAQRFMLAAKFAEGKSDTVSFLQPSTIYLLSAPSTPEQVCSEIIEQVRAKKPVHNSFIKMRIKETRRAIARTETRKQNREARKTADKRRAQWQAQEEQRRQKRETAIGKVATVLAKLKSSDIEQLAEALILVDDSYSLLARAMAVRASTASAVSS
jgi:hypothetical protein